MERLTAWGAHAAYGSRFPDVPFTAPLDQAGILTPTTKVEIAERLCAEFGVTRADCVAYGDSRSDAELFGAVPVSVAINADDHLVGLATHSYVGLDLWDAYQLACRARWLREPGVRGHLSSSEESEDRGYLCVGRLPVWSSPVRVRVRCVRLAGHERRPMQLNGTERSKTRILR
ncbi:hypothetical protein GCM10023083_46780 [Streptomyces phyllanthi]